MSLLSEELPSYTLRADCMFGYEHDDWLQTPVLPPETALPLTPQLIEETLKYFLLCSERVGQVTKTYHDIEALTHLLEEKERDLELAAQIGQLLLGQNQTLVEQNKMLDERLEMIREETAQLRYELSMRDYLLQLYTSTEEAESVIEMSSLIRRNESSSESKYINYDFVQKKLKDLEDENLKLRLEAMGLMKATSNYEEQEQQLVMDCVQELSSANKQVEALSDELAQYVEDTLRQQEEITCVHTQIAALQHNNREITTENEKLTQHLTTSLESQAQLKLKLYDLQDKYSECDNMLKEAQKEVKNLQNTNVPNSTVNCYSTLAAVLPMDSLAAEIEGTMHKGLDNCATAGYKKHPFRVFETVKAVNEMACERSYYHLPQVTCSKAPACQSSYTDVSCAKQYDSNKNLVDKSPACQRLSREQRTHGCQDLAALQHIVPHQLNYDSGQSLFESKLWAVAHQGDSPGAFLTPKDRTVSTAYCCSFQDSVRPTFYSMCRSCLPNRLQIVKPLEGSVTLHHWQQLAKPDLGSVLQPRPGVLTKDFRELEVDIQQTYSLNDLEEDEPGLSLFSTGLSPEACKCRIVIPSSQNLPQALPMHIITTCWIFQPFLQLFSFSDCDRRP